MLSLRMRRWVAAALPFVGLWFVSVPLMAQAAPSVSTPLSGADLAALEVIRKDVWVHWFTGDTAQLRRVLAPELVAISADAQHWQSLDETLAGSAKFKAGGGRFVSVTFESLWSLSAQAHARRRRGWPPKCSCGPTADGCTRRGSWTAALNR